MTEYIRKRRLSRATEELLRTDIKIMDLALKYQYNSQIAFTNSFKKVYGISPLKLRKEKKNVKTFSKIEFKPVIETIDNLEYRIVNLDTQKLYGITTGIIQGTDNKSIQKLFNKARNEKILDFIIDNSDGKELYYGVSKDIYRNEISSKIQYYILGKKYRKEFINIEIPPSTWACFKLDNKEQIDILKLYNTIYTKWLPSSEFKEILDYPQLEIYYENSCEICIAVK